MRGEHPRRRRWPLRIVGFGLATLTQAESALAELKGVSPGAALGTPGYMSPEQVRGVSADSRSDIFTLGAIIYEMLTGARAFSGDTPLETMTAVAKSDLPKLAAEEPLPPRLVRLVERCLKQHPASRPTAREAATALDALFEEASIASFSAPAAPVAGTMHEPAVDEPVELETHAPTFSRSRRFVPVFAVIGVLALLAALAPGATRIIESAWLGTVDTVASNASSPPIATATRPDRPVWEFAVSPDGQRLAFTAEDGSGQRQLWVRSLSATDERPLANTGDAAFPFWPRRRRTRS